MTVIAFVAGVAVGYFVVPKVVDYVRDLWRQP